MLYTREHPVALCSPSAHPTAPALYCQFTRGAHLAPRSLHAVQALTWRHALHAELEEAATREALTAAFEIVGAVASLAAGGAGFVKLAKMANDLANFVKKMETVGPCRPFSPVLAYMLQACDLFVRPGAHGCWPVRQVLPYSCMYP
jgi:hypothetical protein